jgi:hypothetical protein
LEGRFVGFKGAMVGVIVGIRVYEMVTVPFPVEVAV